MVENYYYYFEQNVILETAKCKYFYNLIFLF